MLRPRGGTAIPTLGRTFTYGATKCPHQQCAACCLGCDRHAPTKNTTELPGEGGWNSAQKRSWGDHDSLAAEHVPAAEDTLPDIEDVPVVEDFPTEENTTPATAGPDSISSLAANPADGTG